MLNIKVENPSVKVVCVVVAAVFSVVFIIAFFVNYYGVVDSAAVSAFFDVKLVDLNVGHLFILIAFSSVMFKGDSNA